MLKISLTELEEIRRDPIAYKSKRESGFIQRGRSSYFGVLKNTIHTYHKSSNVQAGMDYMEAKLERFMDPRKCQKIVDDFHWYLIEYQRVGWPVVKTQFNIAVPLTIQYWDSFKITGQINRIDMSPNGGYAAWLFRKDDASGWKSELRMPIIQNAIAVELGVNTSMTSVGVYDFNNHNSQIYSFTDKEVELSHYELENLLKKLGN
jgi:hypothetical protein